jgi:hypothetical protein
MSESTAIALRVNDADLARIESIANECSLSNLGSSGRFMRAFKMAAAIRAMRQAITKEMMQDLMELQGTKLGFRTDKDKDGGYPPEVVKDCAIEATLRGGYWIGNEFNIIASSCYLTKEYFIRILREFPGLTDLRLEFGAPVLRDDKAWVACKGSWKLHGRPDFIEKRAYKIDGTDQMLDERLVIKCNKFMGEDAVLGKAERKLRAAIYSRITGTEILEGEADEVQEPTVRKLDDLANRLEGKAEVKSGPRLSSLRSRPTNRVRHRPTRNGRSGPSCSRLAPASLRRSISSPSCGWKLRPTRTRPSWSGCGRRAVRPSGRCAASGTSRRWEHRNMVRRLTTALKR